MRAHLLSHDGEIEEDFEQFCAKVGRIQGQCGYLLVPHTILHSDVPSTSHETKNLKVVTDMWLERCLHRMECVDPKADPTSAPFRLFPIPGVSATLLAD